MSILDARKSSFDNSLLTFHFRLWPPPTPSPNFFLDGGKDWDKVFLSEHGWLDIMDDEWKKRGS